jgi:hypothetical protein
MVLCDETGPVAARDDVMFSNFQSSYNYSEDEDDTDRGEPFTHVSLKGMSHQFDIA